MFKLFKKKPVEIQKEEVPKVEQPVKDFTFFDNYSNEERNKLQRSYNEIMKSFQDKVKDYQPIDNSNINIHTQNFQNRLKDLYSFNNNSSIQQLTYIIQQESIVSITQYEWFLELLVKNEPLAKKILNFPINLLINEIEIFNLTDKVSKTECKRLFFKYKTQFTNILEKTELFGGCYCGVQGDRLFSYQPSQLVVGTDMTEDKSFLNQLNYQLQQPIKDEDFFKDNNCEYIKFNDGRCFPYQNVILLIGSNVPTGNYLKEDLHGLSFSIFEGSIHYLVDVINSLSSLHEQINIQNRLIFKMLDYNTTTAMASKRQYNNIHEAIQKLVATRSTDGFVTDKENEVDLLSSNVDSMGIMQYAILYNISLIWNIPIESLLQKGQAQYQNKEVNATSSKEKKIFIENLFSSKYSGLKTIYVLLLNNSRNGLAPVLASEIELSYDKED